jgi:aminoglycoside 2'-N-acetyltransferase I
VSGELATVHTADLPDADIEAARQMVMAAFDGGFDATDWRHSIGGLHVLSRDADGAIDGHAAIVARSFRHGDRQLRAGWVEGVAVRADRRRRGIGDSLMREVNRIVERGYEFGGLGATDDGARLYRRHGWTPWDGERRAFGPDGEQPAGGGWAWVFDPAGHLDPALPLTCDWRDGDLW